MTDPLYRVPHAAPRHVSDSEAHERETIIRRQVLHSRPRTTSEIVEALRAARYVVTADEVEVALCDAPGVRGEGGRWVRG